jgi:UDP-2,4-diacetamido-2,4,6-trideoxy-beta-L-altropyranose hydrolase
MNGKKTLLIRTDAGGSHGTGHVMRMIALAQAWIANGGEATFAMTQCPDIMRTRLHDEGFHYVAIDSPQASESDADETATLFHQLSASWLVLDGYHLADEYQSHLSKKCEPLVIIDDYGHCSHAYSKFVLNGNLYAEDLLRSDHNPTKYLFGPRYALLRNEFHPNPHDASQKNSETNHILITFGGVDPVGASLYMVKALSRIAQSLNIRVKVLMGSANPREKELMEFSKANSSWLECTPHVNNIVKEYEWADRIICAGGSSCLEWLSLGKIGYVISIAANQDMVVASLQQKILATVGRKIEDYPSVEACSDDLQKWLTTKHDKPPVLIDSWGAERVVAALDGSSVLVRPVDASDDFDLKFLFELANEDRVRAIGFHTEKIPWDTHIAWVKQHSQSASSVLFCGEHHASGRCSFVRFHEREIGRWEIGIAVDASYRGMGIARNSLRKSLTKFLALHPTATIFATIHRDNLASIRLFTGENFHVISQHTNEDFFVYEYQVM